MRVVLLGRKPVACDALRHILSRGAEVVAVSTPPTHQPDPYPESLAEVADSFDLPVVQDALLYDCLAEGSVKGGVDLRGIDLVVSILHQVRIRKPLIELGRIGCVNFHPAPLPGFRGWGTYNVAILEDVKEWGVAAHFVDEGFDTGPLIRTRSFPVDASRETAWSLQCKTQPALLELIKEVFEMALRDGYLPSAPQGPGRSFRKKDVLAQRFLDTDDTAEAVNRKVRAYWYPPSCSAEVRIGGTHYPVTSHAVLQDLVPLICAYKARE
jgi:methionyl-tRNA formyltransferase